MRNREPKVDSKGRVAIMDRRVRNPYLEKSCARKNKIVYLLYNRTMGNNNNH
jgi:hypothetical protein